MPAFFMAIPVVYTSIKHNIVPDVINWSKHTCRFKLKLGRQRTNLNLTQTMKKAFNIILAAGTLLFTASCMEDKGTSFEVTYANEDERVNPNHIRDYYGLDSIAQMVRQAGPGLPQNGQLATEIVKAYYIDGQDLKEVATQFQLSETTRMGGQSRTQAAMDTTDPTSATDQMEQRSMQTVQDSVNVVTGGRNEADARSKEKTGERTSGSGSSTEQQSGTKDKSAAEKKKGKQ